MTLGRILIVRLTALGDVLLATPLARALRRAQPAAEIDWLVAPPFTPLLEANPNLSRVFPAERGVAARLRARRYDLVLDLQNKPRTALLRASLGAARVVSLRKRTFSGAIASLLGRERPATEPHAVELYLSLAARLGVASAGTRLDLVIPERARLEAAPLLSRRGAASLWGLAPSTRWATKRWPIERFLELGQAAEERGAKLLLLGGAADGPTLDALSARLGSALLGDTRALGTGGLAAAIEACDLVVANDSGPAHVAAALGRKLVVLFGPTAPSRWAPIGSDVELLYRGLPCSPCSNHGSARCPLGTHACLAEIPASEVLAAASRRWAS